MLFGRFLSSPSILSSFSQATIRIKAGQKYFSRASIEFRRSTIKIVEPIILQQPQRGISCQTNTLCVKATSGLSGRKKHDDDDGDELVMTKGDKVLKIKLKTTRLDGVLKTGLQISKNRIEKAFFDDRVRLNGERPRKKSQLMNEGDEIDLIRGPNSLNPSFLDISRVEVVKIGSYSTDEEGDEGDKEEEEDPEDYRIPAVLKRYKSLTVENYKQAFKGEAEE